MRSSVLRVVPVLLVAVAGGGFTCSLRSLSGGKLVVRVEVCGRTTLAFFGSSGLTIVSGSWRRLLAGAPWAASFGLASGAVEIGGLAAGREGVLGGPGTNHLLRAQGAHGTGGGTGAWAALQATRGFARSSLRLARSSASAAFSLGALGLPLREVGHDPLDLRADVLGDDKEQREAVDRPSRRPVPNGPGPRQAASGRSAGPSVRPGPWGTCRSPLCSRTSQQSRHRDDPITIAVTRVATRCLRVPDRDVEHPEERDRQQDRAAPRWNRRAPRPCPPRASPPSSSRSARSSRNVTGLGA
jgi:hypothetical protein